MPIPEGVSRDSIRAVVELLSGEGEAALPVQITNLEGNVTIEGDANIDATALEAGIGAPSDAAWDGDPGDASVISILKAIHAQLVIIAGNTA